ncbi:2-octaprenyl-6-methoxyphenol hydroxylase [Legionella beliardensis]|uniref:2-octaprenyl-6-methoxyphenol hydroxylase n=1 Tax=Legionella beliardensis TaxID=91822 RepID=A0A378HX72_9GAMM|nr:FAD-dependent monooxygenase [Legionella beliardensis]STX27518.1 2-octaprenyl-6-methoxyphenol hydroxylase [Legionella beliardensis]
MNEQQVDILIVGGGLIGTALHLALTGKGLNTLLIETFPLSDKVNSNFDARTLALSPASMRILQMLEIWPLLAAEASPIYTIYASEQGRFGKATLQRSNGQPLGYVIEMQHINRAFSQLVDHKKILAPAELIALDKQNNLATIQHNTQKLTLKAKLIIAADGAHSKVRQLAGLDKAVNVKDYAQHALVANIGLARPHGNCAYERFTQFGPLAMLPMTKQRMALVWALSPIEANRLHALADAEFLSQLQMVFGYKLGKFNQVGQKVIYPLKQVIMPTPIAWPLVFIGNAAHTLHPVAGQGFNLGLRDVATLAQCIVQYGLSSEMLIQYQSMRNYDQYVISKFTHGLVELFTSKLPGLGFLRSLGLSLFDNSGHLKKILTHHTRGFAGIIPDLVCGIDL